MLYRIKTVDGAKTKVPLAGSTPAGLPVGSILSTYKKIQPYNYLYCDGSTFDETQYPELYLYLGTNVLPDYRECVPVGAEKNTTDIFDSTETDPSTGLPGTQSHDVFTQGQFKDDQFQSHEHTLEGAPLYGSTAGYIRNSYTDSVQYIGTRNTWGVANGRSGTTTRTKEKAVYYYIKAVDGVDIADEDTFLNTVVNTIQDAQSYSTTEQKTGGKWIDGKPIYRRTFYTDTQVSTGVIANFASWNVAKFIKVDAIAVSSRYIQCVYFANASDVFRVLIDKQTQNITWECSSPCGYSIILEYTKNE